MSHLTSFLTWNYLLNFEFLYFVKESCHLKRLIPFWLKFLFFWRQPTWLLRRLITDIILERSAHLCNIHVKRTLPGGISGNIFRVFFEVWVNIGPDTWSLVVICTAHIGNRFSWKLYHDYWKCEAFIQDNVYRQACYYILMSFRGFFVC